MDREGKAHKKTFSADDVVPLARKFANTTDRKNLKEKWHKCSKKKQEKLKLLLEDPGLKSIGKLFLSTNEKYRIGSGAETKVYVGMKEDGTEVAIKQMIKAKNEKPKNEMSFLRDINLESSYIVRYVDFEEEGEFNYLALQLCESNLDEYMEQLRQQEEEDRMKTWKKLARDVLRGLAVLHEAHVLHRDIKPSNVLIDVKGNARLADFGISRRLNEDESARNTPQAGSRKWEATEILGSEGKNCDYRMDTDIQVAGMLVHYILSDGHHPFEALNENVEDNIRNGRYSLQEIGVEAKDLIEWMIEIDRTKRLTIGDAVDHPYFWDDKRRDTFLRKVGDEEHVQRRSRSGINTNGPFSNWKSKITEVVEHTRGIRLPLSFTDDLLGLIRYLRNLLVHKRDVFYKNNMFKDLFPDFFISAYKLAKEMGWRG